MNLIINEVKRHSICTYRKVSKKGKSTYRSEHNFLYISSLLFYDYFLIYNAKHTLH